MLLDGVSVKGNYHDINQDGFRVQYLDKGFVSALSDGLGSKKNSQMGSKTICDSVIELAKELKEKLIDISPEDFALSAHGRWKEKLNQYDLTECFATMLVFVIYAGRAFAIRLGDGFIGIWADDQLKVLFDKKDDYFANETDCLTEELLVEKLEIYELEISELHGGVMCSDGVGVGNMTETELSSFTREFVEGYRDMSKEDISEDIRSWLEYWPGADDKTLAYFISERN
jgi:hypothetical protein